MSLKDLKKNIKEEKELLEEISSFKNQLEKIEKDPYSNDSERQMVRKVLNSSKQRLRMINNATPELVNSLSPFRKLDKEGQKEKKKKRKPKKNTIKIKHKKGKKVSIKKKDKRRFLRELRIRRETLKRIKRKERKEDKGEERELMKIKKPSFYSKLSNKFFFNLSNKMLRLDYFQGLEKDLKKANLNFLPVTYLSIIFFTTFLASIVSFLFLVSSFFFSIFSGNILPELTLPYLGRNVLISLVFPLIFFFSLYFYPKSEAKSIGEKIDQEIPFVAIHMSAIAGSGIEPSEIFKIIALGDEYPHTKKEMKKIINQINIYGYDLVTALKNTAKETSSQRLSELLNGLSTIISGGGSLKEFLDERAESLLFDYRMEREDYNKSSETFMDIYIGVVIAAPMILTLLFVMMNMTNIGIGLSGTALAVVMVSIVAIINIFFLIFLSLKQPEY